MSNPRTWFALALALSAALLPTGSRASAEPAAGRLAAYTVAGVAPFVVDRDAAGQGFPSGLEVILRTRVINQLRKRGVFEQVVEAEAAAPTPADTAAAGAVAGAPGPAAEPQRFDLGTNITYIDVPSTFARFFGAKARLQARFVCTDTRTGRELWRFLKEGTCGPVRAEQAAQEAGFSLVKALVQELVVATASAPGAPQGPASASGWKRASPYGPWRGFIGVSGTTHQLTASEMNRVYGTLGGVKFDYTYWFRPCWAARAGLNFSSASKKVDVTDPAVKVETNSMDVLSVPMTVEVLRRWRGGDWTREIGAYYGLGIAFIENDETIELLTVGATPLDTLLYVKTDGAYYSYGVTLVAGYQFHIWNRFHGTLEARWLQAQLGRFRDGAEPKDADEEEAYAEFKRLIHRPDYDVTGWQASLGLNWGK